MTLILASGSAIRAEMLRNAGVEFSGIPAEVDETAIKTEMLKQGASAGDIALALSDEKARVVSVANPKNLVLGADQVLVCEGRLFDKPRDISEAAEHLRLLRGKPHQLLSAATVYENGHCIWKTVGDVHLVMRSFTDRFLENYIEQQGTELLSTVGAYKIEGVGAQLFSKIEGDYFSILGLPLLEFLEFLRTRDIGLS